MIAVSGTGAGHVTVQPVPMLPGALSMKNEAGNVLTRPIILDEKSTLKMILHLFMQA